MGKDDEINYLKNMVRILSNRLVYSNKPYDLTINEIQKEIRSLKELSGILKNIQEPIRIQVEPKTFSRRK